MGAERKATEHTQNLGKIQKVECKAQMHHAKLE
jgi:hypothetical protein